MKGKKKHIYLHISNGPQGGYELEVSSYENSKRSSEIRRIYGPLDLILKIAVQFLIEVKVEHET